MIVQVWLSVRVGVYDCAERAARGAGGGDERVRGVWRRCARGGRAERARLVVRAARACGACSARALGAGSSAAWAESARAGRLAAGAAVEVCSQLPSSTATY